jgi:hypothetical protein
VAVVLVGCLTGACAGSERPNDPTPSALPSLTVPLPADGIFLRAYGYTNGPVEQFSLPRGSVVTARVDQTNNVTVVLSAPPAGEVLAYLRRTLPGAGFTVTREDVAQKSMTFTGYGWAGSFTGDDRVAAVLLRPQ